MSYRFRVIPLQRRILRQEPSSRKSLYGAVFWWITFFPFIVSLILLPYKPPSQYFAWMPASRGWLEVIGLRVQGNSPQQAEPTKLDGLQCNSDEFSSCIYTQSV